MKAVLNLKSEKIFFAAYLLFYAGAFALTVATMGVFYWRAQKLAIGRGWIWATAILLSLHNFFLQVAPSDNQAVALWYPVSVTGTLPASFSEIDSRKPSPASFRETSGARYKEREEALRPLQRMLPPAPSSFWDASWIIQGVDTTEGTWRTTGKLNVNYGYLHGFGEWFGWSEINHADGKATVRMYSTNQIVLQAPAIHYAFLKFGRGFLGDDVSLIGGYISVLLFLPNVLLPLLIATAMSIRRQRMLRSFAACT